MLKKLIKLTTINTTQCARCNETDVFCDRCGLIKKTFKIGEEVYCYGQGCYTCKKCDNKKNKIVKG